MMTKFLNNAVCFNIDNKLSDGNNLISKEVHVNFHENADYHLCVRNYLR